MLTNGMGTGLRPGHHPGLPLAQVTKAAPALRKHSRPDGPPYRPIVMDFLVYSRSAPAAADLEDDHELDEQHWSYMDGFADGMTARGPRRGTDRQTWTGSLHVVDLPGSNAAR